MVHEELGFCRYLAAEFTEGAEPDEILLEFSVRPVFSFALTILHVYFTSVFVAGSVGRQRELAMEFLSPRIFEHSILVEVCHQVLRGRAL